jgi:hypothetical protein
MPEGDNPSFRDEFIKFTLFLIIQFISLSKIEVLGYWAVETLGVLQSTSIGLDPGVKM